jgi:hypothetical protein
LKLRALCRHFIEPIHHLVSVFPSSDYFRQPSQRQEVAAAYSAHFAQAVVSSEAGLDFLHHNHRSWATAIETAMLARHSAPHAAASQEDGI